MLLGLMIAYFTGNPYKHTKHDAFLIATGIILTQLVQVLLYFPYKFFIYIESIKLKISCCSLIYEKILSFTKYTMRDGISGQAINILSNEITRFDLMFCTICEIFQHPIGGIIAGYLIYQQIGVAAFAGLAIFILAMPIQGFIGQKMANVRLSTAKRTDKRVRIMLSILNGIQVIKVYGWEKAFSKVVNEIRKVEIRAIARGYNIRATLLSFEILSKLAIFLSLVIYVETGHEINARKAFIVIAYFDYVHRALLIFWPEAIVFVSEGHVSIKRIQEFLLLNNEMRKEINENDETKNPRKGIVLKNATANWMQENSTVGIHKVNFDTDNHRLVAITGHVGSGKTTMLEVILKELPLIDGSLEIKGDVSYAAQQSWVFEGSVRNNIIFTDVFDDDRYKAVTRACSLQRDFELMPFGDQTIVGDKGVSLSGGQRARVTLARAIYKQADIYLLDDPLSAVDPHVCKHIFDECIKGFLRDKIVILVTHQLQYLSQVDHIVIMSHGRIQLQGTFEEVKSADLEFQKVLESYKEKKSEIKRKVTGNEQSPVAEPKKHDEQKIERETQQEGGVQSQIYKDYLKAVHSITFIAFVGFLFLGTQIVDSCLSIFVSIWYLTATIIKSVRIC